MRFLILFFVVAGSLFACTQKPTQEVSAESETTYAYFGDTIDTSNPVEVKFVQERISGNDSIAIKLTGTITEVCKMKGCWMNLDMENGEKMRVTFKDYGFFVPKDAAGKKVVVEGFAYNDVTSVDMLRHFAEDEGKSAEEVAAITSDKSEITFIAHGVALAE